MSTELLTFLNQYKNIYDRNVRNTNANTFTHTSMGINAGSYNIGTL